MKTLKRNLTIATLAFCTTFLTGCHDDDKTVTIGTIAGPETQLAEVAAEVAKQRYGLHIKIVTFSDYLQPNAALNDGDLQANIFQHAPYLNEQIAEHHYKLEIAGKTFVYPMGIYSKIYHNLASLPDGSEVAIPNDPTNEGRALLLLQKAGLITLAPEAGLNATPHDVTSNPKQLKFVELDAAQLARAYQDVEIAVINTNYAIPAGLLPSKDALIIEDSQSPYVNLIVVRTKDADKPWVKELVNSFQSQAVVDEANELFEGQVVAAFTVTPEVPLNETTKK
ncbi:MAG: MetQ/NlpA family ABC transporter substrate-binding protein [Pseudomonadota bacterium]